MGLDTARLKSDILEMMQKAGPDNWSVDQSAQWLTDAINRFVRSGDVIDVHVRVQDEDGADQDNKGKVR